MRERFLGVPLASVSNPSCLWAAPPRQQWVTQTERRWNMSKHTCWPGTYALIVLVKYLLSGFLPGRSPSFVCNECTSTVLNSTRVSNYGRCCHRDRWGLHLAAVDGSQQRPEAGDQICLQNSVWKGTAAILSTVIMLCNYSTNYNETYNKEGVVDFCQSYTISIKLYLYSTFHTTMQLKVLSIVDWQDIKWR